MNDIPPIDEPSKIAYSVASGDQDTVEDQEAAERRALLSKVLIGRYELAGRLGRRRAGCRVQRRFNAERLSAPWR